MNVRTQAHVIGEIPAHVIRVVVDDDIVRAPVPIAAQIDIVGSNAEVKAAEPEA